MLLTPGDPVVALAGLAVASSALIAGCHRPPARDVREAVRIEPREPGIVTDIRAYDRRTDTAGRLPAAERPRRQIPP